MKAKYKNLSRIFKFKPVMVVFFAVATFIFPSLLSAQNKKVSYSFFAEGGETETVFEIDGRSFPVKIGSLGLKGTMSPNETTNIYGKLGFGYSQKQSVSAYNYNLSGSILATSFGGGANKKFPIRNSNFVVMPFIDMSVFNYSSNTFRGKRNDALLKANVKGNTSFLRSGLELQYLTQNGHFFFGAGANNWNVENEISIKTDNMTITPKVWADSIDSFFQTGIVFDTGNSNAVLGMRISDLTFDINTQLVEIFAEVQISFGQK